MSVIFMDGFDGYSAVADMLVTGGWNRRAGVSLNSNTRFGEGYALYQGVDDYFEYYNPTDIAPNKKIYINFAVMMSSWSDTKQFVYFGQANNASGFMVRSTATELKLYNSGTLLATVPNPFTEDVWHHFECEVYHHASAGSFVVKVDKVEVFNETGLATPTTQEHITFHSTIGGYDNGGCYIDDVVIFDDTGSRNNTWMGPVRVLPLYPSGDNSVQWDKSGGTTNAENVDEGLSGDEDTTYVSTDVVNEVDLYDTGDLVDSFDEYYAVQVHTYSRKDDAGTKKIKPMIKVGTDEQFGGEHNLADSYVGQIDVFETKDGTNDWDETALDSMLLGVKLTADS